MQPALRVVKNHIILPLVDPVAFAKVFPTVKVAPVNGSFIAALPFDVKSVRLLKNRGYNLPSLLGQYNWPGRFAPYEHQKETTDFFVTNPRGYCLSGMGTGKTAAALWATDFLIRQGEIQKCLIVAPLSTLDRVWAQEIFHVLPHRRYHILHGSRAKRLELLKDGKADFYIINHDGIEIVFDILAKRPDINHFIIDECFPAGTKISTPRGELPIEILERGDIINSSWGPMPVTKVFQRSTDRMVRLHFEDGTHVDCTPEHPFATDRGWVKAEETKGTRCLRGSDLCALWKDANRSSVRELEETSGVLQPDVHESGGNCGSYMQIVREALSGAERIFKPQPRNILFDSLWAQGAGHGFDYGGPDVCCVWKAVLGDSGEVEFSPVPLLFADLCAEVGVGEQPEQTDRSQESGQEVEGPPCVEQRNFREKLSDAPADTGADRDVQAKPKGERDGDNSGGINIGSAFAEGVHARIGYSSWKACFRVSDVLQSGLWASSVEDRSGSGRRQSQQSEAPSAGPEEGCEARGVRVVRVENIELRSGERVWNLEVAGPHDYVAEGKVVHNCAVYRNARTKRFRTLFQILNRQGIPRSAWGLTGTPTPNAPTDCFGQLRLLTPERYSGGFRTIQNELMTQVSQFKWVPKPGSAERVYELMQPSIRFALEDCIDLPPTIYQERECALSPQQEKHYKEMARQCFTEIEGKSISAINAGVLLGKLCQASLGIMYDGTGSTVDMDFSPRLKVLKEVIEECDEKVIVFVPYTGALNRFYDELKGTWTVEVVDGGVSAGKRNAIFKAFQETANPRVILAHPGTMAHGLTLTAATTIVWAAPVTSTETFLQANARISRPGQTKTAHIVMLHGSAVERRLYQTLKDRRKLQELVLELAKEGGKR